MRDFRPILLAAGLGLLAGCATPAMTKKACLAGDWYGAGLEDGADGLLETAFDARAAACYEHDAGADLAAYKQGRGEGLTRLCNEPGGNDYGRAGRDYLGVCPAQAESAFLSGYLVGRRIHVAEQARGAAQAAYDSAVASVEHHRREIREARKRLDDPEASEKQLEKARKDLDYSRGQLPDAERAVDARLYELGRADEAYEAIVGTARDWRRGDVFLDARDLLIETHALARAEDAISFCTDELPDYRPHCEIRAGGLLRAPSGAVCAAGPGVLRFIGRRETRNETAITWAFYGTDARGRAARNPSGEVRAIFSPEREFLRLDCGA